MKLNIFKTNNFTFLFYLINVRKKIVLNYILFITFYLKKYVNFKYFRKLYLI